jgi:FMN hydrolase / 5-amino-6-(5-phospho-D-ribitylamino)uracil phosphatase
MKNISDIKVISVDLFRTLAKMDDGYDNVWRTFLGDKYTDTLARRYWDGTSEVLFSKLDQAAACLEPFKTTRDIFAESYSQYFREIELDYDPDSAAETLILNHRLKNFFEDAKPFLESVARYYEVCLSTDCDTRMLESIDKLYIFNKMFVSEELRAYKAHPLFFTKVLGYYRLKPENILHIGDSKMDIITPGRMGLQTCWLNRTGNTWQYDIKPDYQVKSLSEILKVLKVNWPDGNNRH